MKDILRLTNLVAQDILRVLLSGEAYSPMDLAKRLKSAPQTVRNALVVLKNIGHVKNEGYGKYVITPLGRETIKRLSQPSTDQSSGESKT